MDGNNKIQLFEDKRIRTVWFENTQEWYFSVIDIVSVLTGTDNPRRYWNDLKRKLRIEGSQLYEKIVQLKMTAEDGKMRLTDVASTVLNMLAEATTTEISKTVRPETLEENQQVPRRAG